MCRKEDSRVARANSMRKRQGKKTKIKTSKLTRSRREAPQNSSREEDDAEDVEQRVVKALEQQAHAWRSRL